MTPSDKMKLISTLCLGALANGASAAGFQLLEQNASGLGNAYAGSAAVAENASTIFYNPAGMTQLQNREFSGGLTAVNTRFKFSNQGSSVGLLAGAGEGGDGGGWGFIPNAYLSWGLNKDLYLGVGFGAPFGLKTEYDNPWLGAAQSVKFDIKTYNINPSIAYRVNDLVSVGAGLNWQRMSAEYLRQAAVVSPVTVASPILLELGDNAWGWNVGALFTLAPGTKLGLSYRSTINYRLKGDIQPSGPSAAFNTAQSSGAEARLKLPDVFVLSAAQQVSDRWQLLGDVSWTGWSSIRELDVVRTSGAGTGTIAQTLDADFQNTWRVAVGANYRYSDALKLKFGIAYDETPVRSERTRLVALPDNNRTWLSLGTQWTPARGTNVDFGISYLYVKDTRIDNNQTAAGRGRVTGTFKDSAWILGAQYSLAF